MRNRPWAAVLVVLGAAAPALAQDLELTTTVDPAEVPVGDRFTATVELTNRGEEPVELYELAFDRRLVSFDVALEDGETFTFEKIHPSPYEPRTDWPRAELAPGASWTLEVGFPAVATGELKITAHYARPPREPPEVGKQEEGQGQDFGKPEPLPEQPEHLVAEPVTVSQVPTEDGAERLQVRIITSYGPIRARLFPRDALGTCLHFADLIQAGAEAEGRYRPHFYDGLTFHRIVEGFMVQGGCPQGTGSGDAGYAIPAELPEEPIPANRRHEPGRLSMARSQHPDSAGTQFFICVGTPTHLDGQYTSFGEVTRGMDVAYTIAGVETEQGGEGSRPVEEVVIRSIRLYPVKR